MENMGVWNMGIKWLFSNNWYIVFIQIFYKVNYSNLRYEICEIYFNFSSGNVFDIENIFMEGRFSEN